ncbi:hypothetical protein K9N50_04170 [bacterium]|nr:hypothetical protein [bacterium]
MICKIMFQNVYALCLILFFQNTGLIAAASKDSSKNAPTIYAIEVTGNQITSSELIIHEMILKPGMIATPEALALDQKNIESLGLFNRVQLSLVSDADRAVLQVEVSEPFYIYPFVFGDYNPNDPDFNYLGLGLYHTNIRGLGIRLSGFYWNGYRRGIYVNYDDLWYSYGGKYGLKSSVYFADNEVLDPLDDYYRAYSQRYIVGFRHRLGHSRQSLHFELQWEDTECESESYTLTRGSTDRIASVKLMLENDLRDYQYYPSSGIYTLCEISGNRVVDVPQGFFLEQIDLRGYSEANNLILAGRIWGLAAQNRLPFHKRIVVHRRYMRAGKIYEFPKGTALGLNMEMRFNILKMRYFSFAQIPFAGIYLRNLGVSLEGVIFGDIGFHAASEAGFDENLTAWGGGFQMQVPFIKTIHFLVGWTPTDRLDQPSLTFRTGVTF